MLIGITVSCAQYQYRKGFSKEKVIIVKYKFVNQMDPHSARPQLSEDCKVTEHVGLSQQLSLQYSTPKTVITFF